ncbi:MAG: hypothetical protein IJ355_06665 [Prevotella sp.]|nr:hypothetical protein [Prevotella sp.]
METGGLQQVFRDDGRILTIRNNFYKKARVREEFENENLLVANLRVLRVHLLSSEPQDVTTKTKKVCNKIAAEVLP